MCKVAQVRNCKIIITSSPSSLVSRNEVSGADSPVGMV